MTRLLSEHAGPPADTRDIEAMRAAEEALVRAREVAARSDAALREAELVALEVRAAIEILAPAMDSSLDEVVLGRIFGQFCVGK